MNIFRIAGGRIQEVWVNMDRLGEAEQLGWIGSVIRWLRDHAIAPAAAADAGSQGKSNPSHQILETLLATNLVPTRVAPPSYSPSCSRKAGPERVGRWRLVSIQRLCATT